MNLLYFHNGLSTVCLDTPENWKIFHALKAKIAEGRSEHQDFNRRLQAQIAKENKYLRSLSR